VSGEEKSVEGKKEKSSLLPLGTRHSTPGTALLLSLLQPFHAFDERVPPVHERDHETAHAKVPRPAVVNGRLVPESEVQVVGDLVPERESDA